MLRIIPIIFLALALGGCPGQLPPLVGPIVNSQYNPITRERLYAAEASYKVANDAALAYRNLRQCRKSEVATLTNICRRYSTTLALQAASRKVNAAFVVARNCLRDSPNTVDCVSGVESAVATFRSNVISATGALQ